MRVLELFAGSGSFGKAAHAHGCEVFSSDIRTFERLQTKQERENPSTKIDYKVDIRDFDLSKLPYQPDIIWASPPCTAFSVASCWLHWKGPKNKRVPATDKAHLGIELVKKTLELIRAVKPRYWFIENPRGMLRKQAFMTQEIKALQGVRRTITYCRYGDTRMKPTDIWTNCLEWIPKPMCKPGMSCHEPSKRGMRSGVMRQKNSYERSKIPDRLCTTLIQACLAGAKKQTDAQIQPLNASTNSSIPKAA